MSDECQECQRLDKALERLLGRAETAKADADRLRAALRGLMMMIENGYLVRDTRKDGESDYVFRMIPLVKALAEAEAALAKEEP